MAVLRLYNSIKSVEEVISGDEALKNFRESVKEFDLIDNFYEIFPNLKSIVVPVKIEKKIIFIKVENSTWRNELRLKQHLLVNKVNSYYQKEILKGIRFL